MADGAVLPGEQTRRSYETAPQLRTARPAARRVSLRLLLLVLGPLAVIAAGLWYYLATGRYMSTENAYVQADTVQLSTDVSGIVTEIDVHDNDHVAAGQVLFKLDQAPFRFALENAQAQLAAARNDVQAMRAQWHEKQQEIRLAQVSVDFAQRDWNRKHELFDAHVVAQSSMDQTQQALDSNQQRLASSRQDLAVVTANLGGTVDTPVESIPRVKAAQAMVDQAQHNLDDTVVRAKVAGVVTNVPNLQIGHYLQASSPGFSLVASDDVWVTANPKETELTWVRAGQPVTISVDTYPGVRWSGKVASLSPASTSEFSLLPAQSSSGNWVKVVQRIPIRISVDADPSKPVLRAGMSAEIDIDTGHERTLGGLLDSVGL